MNTLERIQQLRQNKGWTEYRLSEESGIAQSTISSWFKKDILPSIGSLKQICKAFNVTLSQFFAFENEPIVLDDKQWELLTLIGKLSEKQQDLVTKFLKTM